MDFPIAERMDPDACYAELVEWLHPDGFACPRCARGDRMAVHRRRRPPVLDHRCGYCGRVFNALSGTALHGVKRGPVQLVLILSHHLTYRSLFFCRTATVPATKSQWSFCERRISDRLAPVYAQKASIG